MPSFELLIAQILTILLAARLIGWLSRKIHQPRVIGEMVAGILLGPSLFGWIAPDLHSVLMNTRGLVEMVILNIDLDLGILSPALFSIMVMMALVTTLMTTPLLRWIYPEGIASLKTLGNTSSSTRVVFMRVGLPIFIVARSLDVVYDFDTIFPLLLRRQGAGP